MAKTKTLEELYILVDNIPTKDQKTLKEYLEKSLKAKADAAREELNLIEE